MDLEQLKIEHDMIDRQAADLLDMAAGSPSVHDAASARLARLATLVASHLKKENALVYATVAKVRGRSAAQVWAIITEYDALKADWEAYLAEWSALQVANAWAEFQHDTAAILTRLRARVQEETQWLYPLALEHGVLRMRVQ